MNPRLRIAFIAAAACLLLLAVGALAWRWGVEGAAAGSPLNQPLRAAVLFLLPCFMAGTIPFAERHLASQNPRLAEDHRRYLEVALTATFLSLTVVQVWLAASYVQDGPIGGEAFLRLVAVWVGVSLAVRGNFMAKAGPPSGDGAPPPAVWGRSMMRAGRVLVGWGLTLVVLALILPPKALFVAFVATSAILVVVARAHRRAVRPSA